MKPRLTLQSVPTQICILRLSAIGDVTHVIPVLRVLKKNWPNAEVTWICSKFEYNFLHIIDDVNFIIFDKKKGLQAYFDLWKVLKKKNFDVLLHMQVSARANMVSLCIKADIRLGWDRSRSRDLHQLFINHSVKASAQQHQVQGFLSFARALGLQAVNPEWNIPVTEDASTFANKYIEKNKPLLILSACSSHKLRNWFAERYAEFADYAINKYGMQVILSGGPSELETNMAQEIEEHMKMPVLNLVGKDTLEQLIGLLSRATVVLSPDSGPAHIANALGVPVIGLYACTRSKRSGPYNSLKFCVDKFDLAAEKYTGERTDRLRWGSKIETQGVMELITVNDVCNKLDLVMSTSD